MPRCFNAADGRFWAAEFASGPELYESMTGPWLLAQPGIDRIIAKPLVHAIRQQRPRLLHGDFAVGTCSVTVRAKGLRLDARHFDGSLSIWDEPLDAVVAERFPTYAGVPCSRTPLGGRKHGQASEWDLGPRSGTSDGPIGTAGWIAIAIAVLALVIVFVLWGRQIAMVMSGIGSLIINGALIWMAWKAWRWLKG